MINKTITHAELIAKVMAREKKGGAFVTLQTVTDPKMVKKHRETKAANPYLGANKITVINGIFGTNYESCVNRQQTREGGEGDFEAGQRVWGEHFQDSKTVIHHKGKFYLALRPNPTVLPKVEYVLDGKRIAAELLKDYLPAKRDEETAEKQGVERIVRCTDYCIDNIQQITMDGETFTVIH